jgi:hypothetical protein
VKEGPVATATGPSFTAADLLAHEPELLLEDFSDFQPLLTWLEGLRSAARA